MPLINDFIERGQPGDLEAIFLPAPAAEISDQVEEYVKLALACSAPARQLHERRTETRHAYPYPVYLTPLDKEGEPIASETIIVIGKHLCDHGVDFYHRAAVPHRELICSLRVGDRRWVSLLLELSWCRLSSHGWYENGGKFLRPAHTPAHLTK